MFRGTPEALDRADELLDAVAPSWRWREAESCTAASFATGGSYGTYWTQGFGTP